MKFVTLNHQTGLLFTRVALVFTPEDLAFTPGLSCSTQIHLWKFVGLVSDYYVPFLTIISCLSLFLSHSLFTTL